MAHIAHYEEEEQRCALERDALRKEWDEWYLPVERHSEDATYPRTSHSGSGQHAEAPSQQQRSMHGGSLSSHPIGPRDGDSKLQMPRVT